MAVRAHLSLTPAPADHGPVLHIATSHSISPRWIEIQTRHLREHIKVPFTTWASLPLIDAAHGASFDMVIEQKGPEAGKLNHLALEISQVAQDQDLLMFLSPDAFPIADPIPMIEDGLSRTRLIAVRRAENGGDVQPYPCFCVTTVGAWRDLAGDWSDGYPWSALDGRRVTDLGGNLLRRLELSHASWTALSRSNPTRLDPLFFAIYEGVIYHHGAGEITRAHRVSAPGELPIPPLPGVSTAMRRLSRERRLMWERRVQRRFKRRSDKLYQRIADGGSGWLAEVS